MQSCENAIEYLQRALAPTRHLLLNNSLYFRLETIADLRQLMEHHVFAVWDFMSLLKALQRDLTCVQVPWLPTANAQSRRLVNEIVLEEESDLDANGQPSSHFELYLRAMQEAGANTRPIKRLITALREGRSLAGALDAAQVPDSVRQFVTTTFDIIGSGRPHAVAAAFAFGREDPIPAMFRQLVGELSARFPGQLDAFAYYLDRRIQLDGENHAPLAQHMVCELCGDDPVRWQECQEVAVRCMEARMALWDGIKSAKGEAKLLA